MRKIKSNRSRARFWIILIAINVLAIGYVLGLYLHAVTSDEQLFAAMAIIFAAFLMVITDIVSIVLACEVWLDQRH
jgi:heme/copper-type cytochrome/quinol oxidase subunit 4